MPRTTYLALLAALLVSPLAPCAQASSAPNTPSTNAGAEDPQTSQHLRGTLSRIGLTPEAFTAAGCSDADVSAAASVLNTHLLDNPDALSAADDACFTARIALVELEALIKSGKATEAEKATLPEVKAAIASADADRDALLAEAFAIATVGLDSGELSTIMTIRGNSRWQVETYYLVIDRDQAGWVELREALDEQRIAAKYDEEVSSESLAVIANALGDSKVAAAKVNLDTNLTSIEAAWNAATA